MKPLSLIFLLPAFFISLTAALPAKAEDSSPETVEPEWKAAVASAVITPSTPLPMSGYAGRKNNPSEGTEQDLFAKALAVEDRKGNRVVIITMDLIGVIQKLREDVESELATRHELPPHALVMNASHTHCGPSYGKEQAAEYYEFLRKTLVDIAGQALSDLKPAKLAYCRARCSFAMNRRTPTEDGYKNHPNPDGVVDHTVPVIRVSTPDDELKAVLFGYACHNTTMGFMKWLGDYAGYAQEYFEKDHPGVTAMFVMGCSADQNPYPRSMLHYAQRHGRSLATAVEAALEAGQRTLRHQHLLQGPLRAAMEHVKLEATNPEKEALAYPVQVVQFGDGLCLITLGNEVVVDYSLRLKKELARSDGPAIWVAGYSNHYGGYIPSKRVIEEGGYEARCCPWKPDLEERIVEKVHALYGRLNPSAGMAQ